jgi:mannonate dehydratase
VIDLNSLGMRMAVGQVQELTEEDLQFTRQCGLEDILMNTPRIPGEEKWAYKDLLALRSRAESFGVRLICLENVPVSFYDEIMLGKPGRERQLENMQETVRNMGRAGIPILGYNWMPNKVWRTEREMPIRGGAISNGFQYDRAKDAPFTHGREYSAEEMWDNYHWYMERMLPVCEEVGVRMAIHPDDPPVPALGGIARIFSSFEGFAKAMDAHPSPMHGLDYCHGCWSEMRGGAGVLESIGFFGSRGRLFYVHLRDVQGSANDFTECFIDEGNSDVLAVMRKLKEVGFRSFIIDDHVPRFVNDSRYGHRGRAYAIGYIKAMLDVVNREA